MKRAAAALWLCIAYLALLNAQPVPRVYVYDLPKRLTEDVVHRPYQESWLLSGGFEYEADLWVYNIMVNGPWRVKDPGLANVFYIPVLPTRFLHQALNSTVNWQNALELSADYLREALELVRKQPHWARRNGRDHFVAMTADSARCTHLRALPRSLWGDLSVILHLGDLAFREEGIPCFDPDADILLPAFNPLQQEPLTDVFSRERNITALYRFGTGGHTAQRPYHTKFVRQELYKEHEAFPLPGSDFSSASKEQTMEDMTSSIFCICPPGIVAHTSRFWRALRRGCVPVTFFRAFDLAFSAQIDYSSATVNIQPDNIHTVHNVLSSILRQKARLRKLQQQVQKIQKLLIWDDAKGIQQLFAVELLRHVAMY